MDVLAELMPQLSAFRSMGYSFGQLTSILNEAGFSMPQTAVEACYGELLEKKMEMCTKRFCEKFQVPELGLGDMFSELFLDSALKDARSINSGRANMGHPADG